MYFLDELANFKLYRRKVLLPLNEKDKRHTSLAFLLSPNEEGTKSILNNSLLVSKYYRAYYTERAVMYYINQEGSINSFEGEYINEEVQLGNSSPISIKFNGYEHNVIEAKKHLTATWLIKIFEKYKVNKNKIPNPIMVKISEGLKYSTKDIIYLVPSNRYPSDFKSYGNFCKFSALMWVFYQINPEIDPWLCMACALKESGVSSLYTKNNWRFNYNLGIICRALDMYEKDNGTISYIYDIIKGYNGLNKLNVQLGDLLSLLSKDLQKELDPLIFGETVTLSDYMGILLEDKKYNTIFKKILYNDRIKTNKELIKLYKKIKEEFAEIKYTYNDIKLYNKLNLFVDFANYNNSYINNSTFTKVRGANAYIEFLSRLLNDNRFKEAGYEKQSVIIPVNSWVDLFDEKDKIHLIGKNINPISCIYWLLSNNQTGSKLKDIFGDRDILLLGKTSFMKINFNKMDKLNPAIFLHNIRVIINNKMVLDPEAKMGNEPVASARAIKMMLVDNVEKSQHIKIDDISADDDKEKDQTVDKTTTSDTNNQDEKKKELVKVIDKASKNKTNIEDALDSIDNNEEEAEQLKKILSDLSTNPDDRGSNISGARASRLLKLQQDFIDSEFEGRKVSDILDTNNATSLEPKLEPVKLEIDSVNPEWKELTFAANMDSYNLNDDILRIFGSFHDKSNPLVVLSVDKEDTSTSEDLIETYTCKYESARGERFTMKLDIPKFVDNKYMVLRGNRKNIPIQLFLMPIIKTEENAVQIVSCYNKIFVRRFGTTSGKSNPVTDKLMKALNKETYKHISTTSGDNTKVCSKYELPIDYIDLAANYSKIETPQYVFLFNQDELHKKYNPNKVNGLCIGYSKKNKELLYYKPDPANPIFFSYFLYMMIETSLSNTNERDLFISNFNSAATAVRYSYSRASILGTNIPLVVICGLAEGLERTLKKANIKYSLTEKRPKIDHATQDIIRFNDGYLTYDLDYASCLLMNGLKQCNTEDYSILDINSRLMYLDFLDMFGGRIKADGLDNFQDCMIDPITQETLRHYKLPGDYVSVLLHANMLLSDNKFTTHGNIRASRRFRRMEQVASYMYEIMSKAYGAYSTGIKHGRNIGFSAKQSAVIDRLLVGNTTDDQSILNALGEYEAYYAVTPKGPSGMNSDRAYSLDKRSYDESMLNIISASTGFAGNVGISRQATIDANVEGPRGYIYNDPDENKKEINSVKSLCMTESLTPFSPTRDDPMRLAMGFIQTSKHGMRCEKSDPLLITSGADEALPYLVSNTFAYKAKYNGKVVEIVEDKYMIVEYDEKFVNDLGNETRFEYINLAEEVQKNSSSGFYVTLKLDTDLKEGKKFKKNDIIAYDKQSFSDEMGADDNIAYNIGTLAKFAILNTDEGFEDSAIVSNALSEGMASDVVLEKEITIPKDSNIYNMVKKGQTIEEGDPLMILQNAYDEEDINVLLKNLADEDEVTNLGRIPIISKVTGVVQDIVIERTVETSECSSTLKKVINDYEKDIKERKKAMESYGIKDVNKILPDLKALPPIGKLKNAEGCVVIRIYLKYHDKFSVGDKLIYGTAVKGVAKDIFPVGLEPYSEYRKDETIHALLSIGSINARMVTSVLITTGINKGLIELSRKVKEMAGLPIDINLI